MKPCLPRLFLLLTLLISACSSRAAPSAATPALLESPSPAAALSPEPRPAALEPSPSPSFSPALPSPESAVDRPSILLISWDGAPAERIKTLMAAGELPHFAGLAERGLQAEYALAPDPPLTFAAHASLATGVSPAGTGLVSNAYHDSRDSFYWYRQAVDEPLEAEPVWVSASRAGLKTATVMFPGSTTTRPLQMADYTVDYAARDAYSRQVEVALAPVGEWDGLPTSFSPPLSGLYRIPSVAQVHLLALDGTDNQAADYDTVLMAANLSGQGPLESGFEGALRLQVGEWSSLLLDPQAASGADFLIQEVTPQMIRLYHTGVHHNRAAPRALLEEVNARFGPYPGGADAYALEHGWISEADYLHLIERSAGWSASVTAWLFETVQPDLLFAWQEPFDAAGHAFLLADPRQANYSDERARQYEGYSLQAARASDLALERMLAPVDLDRTAVLLVSDHGMAPAHTLVYVNTTLERAGLLVLDNRDYVVVERSKAMAVASGGAVNVYLNLQGREEGGIVKPEEYEAVQQAVIAALSSLTDPATGQPVFGRVLPRAALNRLGLGHPHSGDVFAQANPGYTLDGWRGRADLFAPFTACGQHGYDSSLPEMRAFFLAAGAGLPEAGPVIPAVRLVDLAPTIAALLGLPDSAGYEGAPVQEIFPSEIP